MKHETVKTDAAEKETLAAAIKAIDDARISSIEKAKRLTQQRQALASNVDCQRVRNRLLEAIRIDQSDVDRCRQREAMQTFLKKEEREIINEAATIAQRHDRLARQRHTNISAPDKIGNFVKPYDYISLDTARLIQSRGSTPPPKRT